MVKSFPDGTVLQTFDRKRERKRRARSESPCKIQYRANDGWQTQQESRESGAATVLTAPFNKRRN